jgi:hypothetical protein
MYTLEIIFNFADGTWVEQTVSWFTNSKDCVAAMQAIANLPWDSVYYSEETKTLYPAVDAVCNLPKER